MKEDQYLSLKAVDKGKESIIIYLVTVMQSIDKYTKEKYEITSLAVRKLKMVEVGYFCFRREIRIDTGTALIDYIFVLLFNLIMLL